VTPGSNPGVPKEARKCTEKASRSEAFSVRILLGINENRLICNTSPCGPLAHLVERIHGMDEATGSIPVRSTDLEYVKTHPLGCVLGISYGIIFRSSPLFLSFVIFSQPRQKLLRITQGNCAAIKVMGIEPLFAEFPGKKIASFRGKACIPLVGHGISFNERFYGQYTTLLGIFLCCYPDEKCILYSYHVA
jgi:hypothetical protein